MKIDNLGMMKKIDNYCVENLKMLGIVLMENAAIKVVKNIDIKKNNIFTIVCGCGNNGGDGLAVSRQLYNMGKKVYVFVLGNVDNMTPDCNINYNILKNIGCKISNVNNIEEFENLRECIGNSDITIDAIFGTGLSREIEGMYRDAISVINENSKYTISIDVPTGLSSNIGKMPKTCICANLTVSFQMYKRCFLNYNTDKYTGKIVVEDIGIPQIAIDKFHDNEFMIDKDMIRENIKKRDKYCYKGDYGRTLIIAGSNGFTGASYIATQGAVRSGAGLVTLCCSKDIQPIISTKIVEAMTINFEDRNKFYEEVQKANSIAIGPGMGNTEFTKQIVEEIIMRTQCPIVLDADAINILKDNLDVLSKCKNKIILTPHLGEMSRICGCSIEYLRENRLDVSKKFAKDHNVIVLLKGYNSIITDGRKTYINPTGNSAMASGGMGDCLTGIIAAFLAQGYEPLIASAISAYIHGYCGEKLSEKMFCVNVSHVLEFLPYGIKELQQ